MYTPENALKAGAFTGFRGFFGKIYISEITRKKWKWTVAV
jgi:hypothetical protein